LLVASLADSQLLVDVALQMAAGRQAKVGTDSSGTMKTIRIIDGQDKLKGGNGSNSAYLAKPYVSGYR
jgi:hypothetical protein